MKSETLAAAMTSAEAHWVEGELAGIEFEQLLHEAVLERLKASLARSMQGAG